MDLHALVVSFGTAIVKDVGRSVSVATHPCPVQGVELTAKVTDGVVVDDSPVVDGCLNAHEVLRPETALSEKVSIELGIAPCHAKDAKVEVSPVEQGHAIMSGWQVEVVAVVGEKLLRDGVVVVETLLISGTHHATGNIKKPGCARHDQNISVQVDDLVVVLKPLGNPKVLVGCVVWVEFTLGLVNHDKIGPMPVGVGRDKGVSDKGLFPVEIACGDCVDKTPHGVVGRSAFFQKPRYPSCFFSLALGS